MQQAGARPGATPDSPHVVASYVVGLPTGRFPRDSNRLHTRAVLASWPSCPRIVTCAGGLLGPRPTGAQAPRCPDTSPAHRPRHPPLSRAVRDTCRLAARALRGSMSRRQMSRRPVATSLSERTRPAPQRAYTANHFFLSRASVSTVCIRSPAMKLPADARAAAVPIIFRYRPYAPLGPLSCDYVCHHAVPYSPRAGMSHSTRRKDIAWKASRRHRKRVSRQAGNTL